MLFNILAVLSFIVVLLQLRKLVNILPSLMACLIRGKESLNLESSVKLSLDRDSLALAMVIPFCLIAFRYRLYDPRFLDGLSENAYLGVCFAVFLTYMLLRRVLLWVFRPAKMPKKVYGAAVKSAFSFFIILTLILLSMAGIMDVLNLPDTVVRYAMLWVSALIYVLFLLRKTQIFSSSCSVFAAFLYLCALEMIPTGILIVPAIIF